MKPLRISLHLGVADLDRPIPDLEVFEDWMQEQLSHFAERFEGYGRVHVKPIDDLRAEVTIDFAVEGSSVLDVLGRFRADFDALLAVTRGVEIMETKVFKLCFPMVAGERLGGTFIRVNPETGDPMYTDD